MQLMRSTSLFFTALFLSIILAPGTVRARFPNEQRYSLPSHIHENNKTSITLKKCDAKECRQYIKQKPGIIYQYCTPYLIKVENKSNDVIVLNPQLLGIQFADIKLLQERLKTNSFVLGLKVLLKSNVCLLPLYLLLLLNPYTLGAPLAIILSPLNCLVTGKIVKNYLNIQQKNDWMLNSVTHNHNSTGFLIYPGNSKEILIFAQKGTEFNDFNLQLPTLSLNQTISFNTSPDIG